MSSNLLRPKLKWSLSSELVEEKYKGSTASS
uniref:Uncharacterized protein n=1 Tax=Arundo donax TaxID=35708 RepID=A0A0A9GS41_ARUDO